MYSAAPSPTRTYHYGQLLRTKLHITALSLGLSLATLAQAELPALLAPLATDTPSQVLGETLVASSDLLEVYQTNTNFWLIDGQLAPQTGAMLDAIAQVEIEGLLPTDYHQSALQAHCTPTTFTPPDAPACELLFSDAFLTLAHHLASGKVAPESLTPEWKRKSPPIQAAPLMQQLKGGKTVAELLSLLRPKAPEYAALMAELKIMRERSTRAPEWPAMANTPAIKAQMEDPRLPLITERLKFWGDLPQDYVGTQSYDATLQAGIKHFQQRNGLDDDGVIGKSSLQALNLGPSHRVKQLIGNLERWRWLPEDLGQKYIMVNIPSFELKVVVGNQVVLHKPVIVGRSARHTPIFSSRINRLIFNPTWTVPTKIAVEDKLPEIRRDPDFLQKLGIVVYERDRVVDPAGVNWRRLNKNNFPFRLVQQPGPQNALGQVKFVIPNTDDIYMHDTPTRNLFSRAERAFSSGCIRVHKPLELVEWLLAAQDWDMAKIEAAIATGETQAIELKIPVPVHLEYWTAILDGTGAIAFRTDLYDRDLSLWQALQSPASNLH